MPGPQVCVGGCLRVVARGMGVGGRFSGASGTPPPTACPGMGGNGSLPLIRPCGATFPQGGRQGLLLAAAQGFAGRRGRRPYGLPGNGRQREPAPHPALRGHLPPRGKARAVVGGGARFRGASGTPPLRFARKWAAAGTCPSSGPAGPPSPKGEGKGCCWRQREVAAGWGHPALRMGIWKRPRGLRGHPFPGRRTVGAGHARPGGWREQALPFYRLTLPTSPPAYSRCCRRQNRWGRSAHRPHARFRRWIRSRGASGHRRSGPDGTGVCRRRNFSSAG